MPASEPFKWRHFQSEIILLNVRWYLRYSLSYRDLAEMMLERGIEVHFTTIYRWVQAYSPELDQHCRPYLRPTKGLAEKQNTNQAGTIVTSHSGRDSERCQSGFEAFS